jgi:hypothetical protein
MIENSSFTHALSSPTNSQPTIEIGPPEVHTSENSMHILYLSTSMGLKLSENIPFSIGIHQSTPSMPHVPLVSTLVAPLSTSLSSTSLDVVYVNHVSRSHGRGWGHAPCMPTYTHSKGHHAHLPIPDHFPPSPSDGGQDLMLGGMMAPLANCRVDHYPLYT